MKRAPPGPPAAFSTSRRLDEHASFMNALADEGFLRLRRAPRTERRGTRSRLLVVEAESEAEIHRRLAPDPWTQAGLLVIEGIEEWDVIVGGERLAPHRVATTLRRAFTTRSTFGHRSIRIVDPKGSAERTSLAWAASGTPT